MLVGFIIKVTGTMAELVLPYILTHILENVIAEQNAGKIIFYGAVMVIFGIGAWLGNIIANRMAAKTSMLFSKELRSALFQIRGTDARPPLCPRRAPFPNTSAPNANKSLQQKATAQMSRGFFHSFICVPAASGLHSVPAMPRPAAEHLH